MFWAVLPGLYRPLPPLHCTPVAPVTVAFSTASALLAQRVWSAPAFTVGAGMMVKVTWSVSARQSPLPAVVRVSVTLPAAISAALGVYNALSVMALGLKVPVPPLHTPPVAPFTVPASWIWLLLAHTVPAVPASTIGAGV